MFPNTAFKRGKTILFVYYHFLEQNLFFHVKLENATFLHVNNMGDFSLFIEQGISDKKWIGFPEFVILAVN